MISIGESGFGNLYSEAQVFEILAKLVSESKMVSLKKKGEAVFPKPALVLKKHDNHVGIEIGDSENQVALYLENFENGKIENGFLGLKNFEKQIAIDFKISRKEISFSPYDSNEKKLEYVTFDEFHDGMSLFFDVLGLKNKYLKRNK